MHCDTTELFADHLPLSSVNARANVNAEFPQRPQLPVRIGRTRRAIKHRQEAVAGSIDFATSMPRELVTNQGVMLGEKVFPSSVTKFDKLIRGLDYVREQDGGEYAITFGFNFAALAGEKGLDLSKD
jgi:hypothetical protein